jgi:hypothetical protein
MTSIQTSSLLSVPTELLRMIILYACDDMKILTLRSMNLTCKQINAAMAAEWPVIVARCSHTVTVTSQCGHLYITNYFCDIRHGLVVNPYADAWYHYGRLHRDGDLPAIMDHDGLKLAWCIHGDFHRDTDLPAYYCKDIWRWHKRDQLHRVGGPASVSIVWEGIADPYRLHPWDGCSDVSAVDFDWRKIIPREFAMRVWIEYSYCENDKLTKNENRELVEIDGRLLIGSAE